ncbi:MAG: amino acid permease [Acidobacteria bacterium]|nr:amino acid permease [Acidobacteriota bacterium]
MDREKQTTLVRAIGRWSLVALVLNSIIGSSVFGLPSVVAGLLGRASPLAYLFAAAGIGVITVCFAEVASRFREAGGAYLYARAAFGRFIGIQVGWLGWLTRISAMAANANLFVIYLAEFWPRASQPLPRFVILTLLVGGLAAVNYCGVRAGVQMSNVFTLAKLLPLAIFIAVGLFFLRGGSHAVAQPAGAGAWLDAVLLLAFAYGGFESAMIPMAEAKNPSRDAPFALLVGLVATTVVYTLVQVVVIGALAEPAASDRPLAVAARQFLGPVGAALMSAGALVSVYVLMSSSVLNAPRLTYALAERGDFPLAFAAVHQRFRTPHVSMVAYALLTWLLTVAGTFRWNATLSAVARLFMYGSVCAALLALRRKQPGAEAFRLPAGPLFAALGIAFCLVLVSRMGRTDAIIVAATAALALANWLWARRRSAE